MDTNACAPVRLLGRPAMDDATDDNTKPTPPGEFARANFLHWAWQIKFDAAKNTAHVVDKMLHACGGTGYKRDMELERYLRDAKAGWVMGPTNEVLRQFVGKAVLLGFDSLDYWNQTYNRRAVENEAQEARRRRQAQARRGAARRGRQGLGAERTGQVADGQLATPRCASADCCAPTRRSSATRCGRAARPCRARRRRRAPDHRPPRRPGRGADGDRRAARTRRRTPMRRCPSRRPRWPPLRSARPEPPRGALRAAVRPRLGAGQRADADRRSARPRVIVAAPGGRVIDGEAARHRAAAPRGAPGRTARRASARAAAAAGRAAASTSAIDAATAPQLRGPRRRVHPGDRRRGQAVLGLPGLPPRPGSRAESSAGSTRPSRAR